MRIHQFVKVDCNCLRRATNWQCRHCGLKEYGSQREVRRMTRVQAECPGPDAPEPSAQEKFRGFLGGTFDCLAPEEMK